MFEAVEACRVLRETRRCPYKTKFNPSDLRLPLILSTEKMILHGRKKRLCPYFLSRAAAKDSTVVVAPYQYIFNEAIRVKVGLEISGKILIFDEAHNADKIGQEVLSDTLSERGLNNAKRELDLLDRSSDEDLSFLVDFYMPVVDEIREYKLSEGQVPVCYLNGLLNFLSLVGSSERDSYVAIYRRSKSGLKMIEYRCLDPSLAIKPVIKEAYSALIMSGTLSPMDYFTEILGLSEVKCRTYSAIARPENVHAYVDTSISTRFKERNEETLRIYGERIAKLVKKIPNGVLIFFPQRALMNQALEVWLRSGFVKKKGKDLFLGGKRVFEEGRSARENARIVKEYKQAEEYSMSAYLTRIIRIRL